MNKEEFEIRVSAIHERLQLIAAAKLSASEVDDAVQNAILSAWTHLPQLRSDKAFEAWIKRILINECNLILRDRLHQREANRKLFDAATSSVSEDGQVVFEALDEMNEIERKLLLKHHDQGFSIKELSQEMNVSEDVIKMRLYRARRRLKIILISLLIILLGMAVAIGAGMMDVLWFLENRRSESVLLETDYRSVGEIVYNGLLLGAEINDIIWDLDELTLYFTFTLMGSSTDALTIHNANIGVDGIRQDHIWSDGKILPICEWSGGKTIYTYYLDGWTINGRFLCGSEDFILDGKGETFFATLPLYMVDQYEYQTVLTQDGTVNLESHVCVSNYDTGEIIEQGILSISVDAPESEDWRLAYEEYGR